MALAFAARPVAAQALHVTLSAQPPAVAVAAAPAAVVAAPAVPEGQWVFARQYGWVYMPYAQRFTYVPATGYPSMYVYNPSFGWRWVSAPWVVGVGPLPHWGPHGYARFAWYARPWFARPVVMHRGRHHVWVR